MTGGRGAFSIQQFCTWAGIGRTLAYKEIESGKLRTKKVGRRTIITMDAALTWLSALPDGTKKNCAIMGVRKRTPIQYYHTPFS